MPKSKIEQLQQHKKGLMQQGVIFQKLRKFKRMADIENYSFFNF